jgi:hypothetical protein
MFRTQVRSSAVRRLRGGGTAMSAALRPTSSLVVVGARTTEQCTKAMGGGPANGRPSVLTVAKILADAQEASHCARNAATATVIAWSWRNVNCSPAPMLGMAAGMAAPPGEGC